MSNQKKLTIGIILIAIILMAVGYAAITASDLNITASAAASANTDNFKVYFTGENTVKDPADSENIVVTAAAESVSATVEFKEELGLDTKGESAFAILEIKNGSNDVDASSVTVTTDATDTAIFNFEAVMCDSTGTPIDDYAVASGETTYVKVSVELLTSPTDTTTASTTVKLTATPEEAK